MFKCFWSCQRALSVKLQVKNEQACGFQIANVHTPVDAIKYAADHKTDIIIANLVMEQMGRREITSVLSEIK